jgi:hypothetical protein
MLENIDDAGAVIWKEKYQGTMVITAVKEKNACLKHYI